MWAVYCSRESIKDRSGLERVEEFARTVIAMQLLGLAKTSEGFASFFWQ